MEKIGFYELLTWFVPGVLLTCLFALCFPGAVTFIGAVKWPDAYAVAALAALAIFIGNAVQAVASLIDPLLHWCYGGRPSEVALAAGLGNRYLPVDTVKRIKQKLLAAVGGDATDRSLFLYAMQRAEGSGSPRVGTFNALYAYHRALLIFSVLGFAVLVAAVVDGRLAQLPLLTQIGAVAATVAVNWLMWFRTKQRANYYVREVLLTAERVLDDAAAKAAQKPAP